MLCFQGCEASSCELVVGLSMVVYAEKFAHLCIDINLKLVIYTTNLETLGLVGSGGFLLLMLN